MPALGPTASTWRNHACEDPQDARRLPGYRCRAHDSKAHDQRKGETAGEHVARHRSRLEANRPDKRGQAEMMGGPSFLPRNAKEAFLWLVLVFVGAFVGRFFVVFAYRVAHQQ